MQEQTTSCTPAAAQVFVVDAKEERKQKQKASATAAVSPSDFPKLDKRAKKPKKSVERGVVKHKESNLKVI